MVFGQALKIMKMGLQPFGTLQLLKHNAELVTLAKWGAQVAQHLVEVGFPRTHLGIAGVYQIHQGAELVLDSLRVVDPVVVLHQKH